MGQIGTRRSKSQLQIIKEQILEGLHEGKTVRELGLELNLPKSTVANHAKAINKELKAQMQEQSNVLLDGFIKRTIRRIQMYEGADDLRFRRDQQFCENSLIKVMGDTGYLPKAVQEIFLHTDKDAEPLVQAQEEMKTILMKALKEKMEAKNASIISKSNNSKAPETATGKT